MSIYDIRSKVELEQYTIKQAMVALSAIAESESENDVVMLDIARSLLNTAYNGIETVVSDMTDYGRIMLSTGGQS